MLVRFDYVAVVQVSLLEDGRFGLREVTTPASLLAHHLEQLGVPADFGNEALNRSLLVLGLQATPLEVQSLLDLLLVCLRVHLGLALRKLLVSLIHEIINLQYKYGEVVSSDDLYNSDSHSDKERVDQQNRVPLLCQLHLLRLRQPVRPLVTKTWN